MAVTVDLALHSNRNESSVVGRISADKKWEFPMSAHHRRTYIDGTPATTYYLKHGYSVRFSKDVMVYASPWLASKGLSFSPFCIPKNRWCHFAPPVQYIRSATHKIPFDEVPYLFFADTTVSAIEVTYKPEFAKNCMSLNYQEPTCEVIMFGRLDPDVADDHTTEGDLITEGEGEGENDEDNVSDILNALDTATL